MNYVELPATPPLDSLVRCFWFLRGGDLGGESQVIVPDGRLEIILHLGDPFARVDPDGRTVRQAATLVSGQLTTPLSLSATGETDIVGIRFRTAAAGAVLRLSLCELTDRIESLTCASSILADALFAAGARTREPAARAAALSRALLRFVAATPDPLSAALVRSLDAPHAPRVSRVADAYGISARTVERRVLASTGLPASTLRRVLRFRRAFRMLDQAPPGTWARVAAHAGYFDQAHLVRDFRRFAGAAPSHFFRTDPDLARAIMSGNGDG